MIEACREISSLVKSKKRHQGRCKIMTTVVTVLIIVVLTRMYSTRKVKIFVWIDSNGQKSALFLYGFTLYIIKNGKILVM